MPPRIEGVKRAPRKRRDPQPPPRSIFGPIGRADAPLKTAQRVARKRVERAQTRLPERPLPSIPTLRRPTQRQAQTAVALTRRAVRNLSPAQKAELLQDPRSQRKLAPAQAIERQRAAGAVRAIRARPGPAPRRVGLGPATINVDALRRSVLAASSLDRGDLGPRNLVRRSIADLGTLGTAPVLAGYQLTAGTSEALRGHPQRLGHLASGVAGGIKDEVTHPGKAFTEHPLLTTLDAASLLTVGGRVAGATTRLATGGARAARVRPALALSDDAAAVRSGLHVPRTKSGDLTRAGLQDLADARREPLRDEAGKVVTVKDRGRDVPVLRTTPMERERLLRRRANQSAALTSSVEKLAREQAGAEGKVRGAHVERTGKVTARVASGIKGKRARDLVAMVSEGTILTGRDFRENLVSHGRRLEREYQERVASDPKDYRHSGEAQANRDRLETVRLALNDPKVMAQAERIAATGIEHGRRLTAADRELMARNVLADDSGYRSRLMHAAIEHMGARHFTVDEHRALEKAALARERAAKDAVETATGPAKREAYATYQRARRERIAVSGRHPEKVKAHEEAQARVAKATVAAKQAQAAHARAVKTRDRLVGAQASRRGRRQAEALGEGLKVHRGERVEGRAMAGERRKLEQATARAKTALQARRRAEKALRQERHRLRESPMPDTQAALRLPGGKFLSNRDIETFLRSKGRDPETVGFLPGVLPKNAELFGRRAHHTQNRPGSRPNFDKQRRTGELYRKGASTATADLLRDQGVRQATQLAKAEQIDKFIGESGVRHPAWAKARTGEQLTKAEQRIVNRGGYWTGPEAAEAIERLAADTGEQYRAVTAYGGKLSADTQAAIRDAQNPGAIEGLGQRLFNDRIIAPEELGQVRTRNVVIAPAELLNQMDRHLAPAGEIERAFQLVNRAFRLSVLPQPRWLAGNFVEPYFIRLPAANSGVINIPGLAMDWAATRKATRLMRESDDPRMAQLAKEIEGQQFGGMLLGRRGASVRRTRDDFKTYGHIVKKLPAIEQFADLAGKAVRVGIWPLEKILQANRPLIEAPTQRAAFGRQLRKDIHEISGSYLETFRLGDKAVREALDGLVGTPTQERFMRNQHELLGKYEGYGPTMRRLIQTIIPFAPWALSAARFVYWTMPIHHTAKTALLVKTQQVVQSEWDKDHADAPPGSLRLAARTKAGGFVDFARYTPYGLSGPIVEGDPQGATDQFLPQLSGALAAMSGTDPFGRPLQVAPSPDNPRGIPTGRQKLGIAGYSLLEAGLPYLSTGRRLLEHGETPFAGSTILHPSTKPGTSHGMSAARRTFDPFRPTYLRKGGGHIGEVVKPTGRVKPQRPTQAQRDADLLRRAVHGPAASGISSEDLDLIRQATRGR
jgi:hypothetical protein